MQTATQDHYHDGAHASTAIDDDHDSEPHDIAPSAPAGHPEDSTLEPSPVSFAAELSAAALEDHDRDADPASQAGEPERYEPPRRIVHAAVVKVITDSTTPLADHPTLYDLFTAWQAANAVYETIDLYRSHGSARIAMHGLGGVVECYRRFAAAVVEVGPGVIIAVSPVMGFTRANGDGAGVPLTTVELTEEEGREVVKIEAALEREKAGRVAVATTAERTVA